MINSENILLGGLIWNPESDLLHKTAAEWFTTTHYGGIIKTMQRMSRENKPMDYILISKECSPIPYDIIAKAYTDFNGENILQHWAAVKQEYTRRTAKRRLEEITFRFDSEDPFALLKEIQEVIDQLQLTRQGQLITVAELIKSRIENLEQRRNNELKIVGHRTGWQKLDKYIGGFVPGEMIVVAGRPGMGKTSFAVSIARKHAEQGGRVCFYSIEMNETQLGDRLISLLAQVDNMRVRNADISDFEMNRIRAIAADRLDFLIETSSMVTIDDVRARIKSMNPRPTLVMIDYIQLIHGSVKRNREQEVSYISRQCKLIAKDCGCTVMALAQLNREAEDTTNAPKLKHLRESGAIEQDADTVLFPFRPQYYSKPTPDDVETDCEVIIAKCRNGRTGSLELSFRGATVEYLW